jgi:hypothetical protein
MSGTQITSPTVPVEEDLQPVDWQVASDAVYDWLNSLLSLEDRIRWENFNEAQPEYPYISLLRSTIVSEGGLKEDRQRTLDDQGQVVVNGSTKIPFENESQSYEPIQFTVTATAHVSPKTGGRDPNCDAMKLLGKAKASLGLRSVIDTFSASGLSIVEDLDVLDTSVVVNAGWIRKATLDVIFRTASVMTEKVGFIDKVRFQSDDLNVDFTVDASI